MTANPEAGETAQRVADAIRASSPVHGLTRRSPMHRLGRRRLGPGAVLAQSFGSIAPAAASSVTPALAMAVGAGSGATWSALLALGAALVIASMVNVFTRRMAAPSSLYAFAAQGLGRTGGFLSAAALLVGYGAIAMMCVAAATLHFSAVAGRIAPWLSSGTAVVAAALTIGGLLTAVIAVIVRRGTSSTWAVLLGLEVLSVLAVLVACALLMAGPADATASVVAPEPRDLPSTGPLGLLAGVLVCASGFVGFESGSALGPEARRPFRVVPRVIRWTPLISGSVLLISTFAQVHAFGLTDVDPTTTPAPLHDLLAAFGYAGFWPTALDLAVGCSFALCAIASITALVRLLFALGTEGVLPARLARVNRRFRTPTTALAWSLPVIVGVPALCTVAGMPVRDLMDTLTALGVLGYMLAYLGVCAAVLPFLRRIGEITALPAVTSVAAVTALVVLIPTYAVLQIATGAGAAVLVMTVVAVVAVVAFLLISRHRPHGVEAIGLFDATSAEDVLHAARPASGGRGRS